MISIRTASRAGLRSERPIRSGSASGTGARLLSATFRRSDDGTLDWIAAQGIDFLAIHFDLDVLKPRSFRSVLFARPGRGKDDFGGVAEGELVIADVLALVYRATRKARPVDLTIAEHLPWDAIPLKNMLERLPLIDVKRVDCA